jgi:K+-sensing histidine kinase KdpD
MPVHWTLELHRRRTPVLGYGISVLCVAIGLALSLAAAALKFRDVEMPLLSFAIAVATWSEGIGPGALAAVLATLCFDYFFTEPFYSFYVSTSEIPRFLTFVLWAVVVAYFAALQGRIERDLRNARDNLQVEVQQRTQDLANRAAELQAANKELESFAYSVSHDLRAPLRHIIGFAELLQKQATSALDGKSRRYITTIQDSARRMGNLIDDLLGFSRVGRAQAKKTTISLEQLVKEAIAEVAQETGGRDIAWKIGPLPPCYGDRSMLKLVLVNLIANAVKFTRTRTRAEVEIGCANAKQDDLEVFVRDNGVGFDMRYANKLFGVFQRLHSSEEFEGTGIGLATVQRIIHRHGGEVRAEGAPDGGATFYFSIPKVQRQSNGGRL